jgi:anti-sigma factor RsiW
MTNHVQDHRRRLANRGMKRVEVAVPAADADLLRRLAKALAHEDQQAQLLRQAILGAMPSPPVKFKDWLKSPSDDKAR